MGAFDLADDGAALFDHRQGASLNNPAWHPGISTAFGGGNALSGMVWTARFPSGLELELERAGAGVGRWAWGRGEARLVPPSVVSDNDERFRFAGQGRPEASKASPPHNVLSCASACTRRRLRNGRSSDRRPGSATS